MPARRLPWVKLWPELMEREKIRQLNDSQYRTWTYCLLASSQLPERWRFDSLEHAAYLTRRPIKDVRALAAAHFLEARDDGVWMHDIGEYQDVYPSDIQRERSANPPPNTPPRLGKHSANGRANATPNAPPTVVDVSLETGDVRREIETRDRDGDEDVRPPAPAERPPTQISKPTKIRKPISNETIERLVVAYGPQFGDDLLVRDWITRALNHTARLKSLDEALYVERTWLKPELAKLKARSDTAPTQEADEAMPVQANRAFQNCTRCGIRRLLVVSTTPLCGACADITVVAA